MIFRLSQKLATKLKAGTPSSLPPDHNPYADWSAHVFTADHTQYILVTNTKSLYSVVMYGKGITDDSEFIDQALSTMRDYMEDDGLLDIYRQSIAPNTGTVQFGKALNRSVTGSMNDLIKFAKMWMTEGELSSFETSRKLNDMPMSAAGEGSHYGFPREAFLRLANEGKKAAE